MMQNSTVMTTLYRLLDNPKMKTDGEILIVMAVVILVLCCILAAVVIADKRRQREANPTRDGGRMPVKGMAVEFNIIENADAVRKSLREKGMVPK